MFFLLSSQKQRHGKVPKMSLFVYIVYFFLLTISCSDLSNSSGNASNSNIELTLSSYSETKQDIIIFDTLGNKIRIEVSLKYPEFIDSVNITVADNETSLNDLDTSVIDDAIIKFGAIRIIHTHSQKTGMKTVIATAFIEDGTIRSDSVLCSVLPQVNMISNYPPMLSITGNRAIAAGDLCTLHVNIEDNNHNKTYTKNLIYNSDTIALSTNHFIYRIPASDTVNDTLTFIVIDNGVPEPLSDTETVIIAIFVKPPAPPQQLHIMERDTNSITFAWDKSPRAEYYSVFKSDIPTSGFIVYAESLKIASFIETLDQVPHYYFVKAQNHKGISDPSNVVSSEGEINTPPQWDITDTLRVMLTQGTTYSLALADTCIEPQGDPVSFSITPNSLVGNSIEGTTFTCNPGTTTGTFITEIIAKDPQGLSSTLTIKFTITPNAAIDTTPPAINFLNIISDHVIVNTSSTALHLAATDESGIAVIQCSNGTVDYTVTPSDTSTYVCEIEDLIEGIDTKITITVKDNAAPANTTTSEVFFKYVPADTAVDHLGPDITLKTPMDSSTIGSSSMTVEVICTDPSGVASISCSLGDKNLPVKEGTDNMYTVDVMDLIVGSNTLTFTATDSASSSNTAITSFTINYDPTLDDLEGPVISFLPSDTPMNMDAIPLLVSVIDTKSGVASVTCSLGTNALEVTAVTADTYSVNLVGLVSGENTVTFTATDKSTNITTQQFTTIYTIEPVDSVPPEIVLKYPEKSGMSISENHVTIHIEVTDENGVASLTSLFRNKPLTVTQETDNKYIINVTELTPGENTLTFTATDRSSNANQSSKSITLVYDPTLTDSTPPSIIIQTPGNDKSTVSSTSVTVGVKCTDINGIASVTCIFGNKALPVNKIGSDSYSANISGLTPGENSIIFTATDGSANANKTTFNVTVIHDPTITDNVGPIITLKNPGKNGVRILENYITVQIECTDDNGIASVTCTHAGELLPVSNEGSKFSTKITNLLPGKTDTLTFVATDQSTNANSRSLNVTFTHDPSINDNIAPSIILKNPATNGMRILKDFVTIEVECKDDNGIASVSGTRAGQPVIIKNNGALYSTEITKLTAGKSDTVVFTATDNSLNANSRTFKAIVMYNTPIEAISLEKPLDKATGIEYQPLFSWFGGQDLDGEAVYFKVKYGISPDNLNYSIEEKTSSPAIVKANNALSPYTTYYWQVIAYSKNNMDKQESEVRSFTTKGVEPSINDNSLENIKIEQGKTLTLSIDASGTPSPTFQWYHDNEPTGISSKTYEKKNVTEKDAGSYYVEVSNEVKSNLKSKVVNVTIITPPSVEIIQKNADPKVGDTIVFETTVSGSGPFSFLWKKNGQPIPDAIFPTFEINNIDLSHSGTYSIEVTSANGSSASKEATLSIRDTLKIVENLIDATINKGDNLILKVKATGTGSLTYQWFYEKDNKHIKLTNQTKAVLKIDKIEESDGGKYYVVISNGIDSDIKSNTAEIIITTLPTLDDNFPTDKEVIAGTSVSFSVKAHSTEPLFYQWQMNDDDIYGANLPSLEINKTSFQHDGASFQCIVSNSAGSVKSKSAKLKLRYTITYDKNTGDETIFTDKESYKKGMTVSVKKLIETGFTNEGFTFIGWSTDKSSSEDATIYTPVNSNTNKLTISTENITLYALWEENPPSP